MKKLIISYVCIVALLTSCEQAEPQAQSGARWTAKSELAGLSELQRNTYRELAKLHTCKFHQSNHRGAINPFLTQKPNPMANLLEFGLDVLPILVEALDDTTPSKTITTNRRGVIVWKVNNLIVMLIRQLADREFIITREGEVKSLREATREKPELIPAFQELILRWYQQNKGRSIEERKIADLQSSLVNRLHAMTWLGKHKSMKATPHIIERIDRILNDEPVTSSSRTELAEASLALGSIGISSSLPVVKKACEHLSYWFYMSYRPIEQGRSGRDSGQIEDLFKTYHGMALLGNKKQALTELQRLLSEYGEEMESRARKEYIELLKNAEEWKEALLNEELNGTADTAVSLCAYIIRMLL